MADPGTAAPEPPPVNARWIGLLTCCGAALVAGCLTLSDLPHGNTSDSLIPIFASLYRWTWFYWGQNRYGLLTALLAIPVQHPLLNLLFQNWMITFAGLLAFPLTGAYLLGWRSAPLVGLVAGALFMLAAPASFHGDYLLAQPYAVSTCLGLAGLLVMDPEGGGEPGRDRQILGGILCFLSYWVSLAAVFLVLPLFVLNGLFGRSPRRSTRKRFVACLALVFVPALINWRIAASYPQGDFGWSPLLTWPGNLVTLLGKTYGSSSPAFVVAVTTVLGVGAVAWRIWCSPARRRKDLAAFAVAVLTLLFYAGVFAATEHVRRNGFPFRYALASLVLFLAAIAVFTVSVITETLKPRWQALLQGALLVGVLTGSAMRYGFPSYARVHAAVDRRFGAATTALIDNHVTHVLGNYWDVWGAVFHANLKWYESGSKRIVWGLTARSEGTRDLWYPALDGGLVAVPRTPRSDEAWPKQITSLKLPEMKLLRETPTIRLFTPSWRPNERRLLDPMQPQTTQVNLAANGPRDDATPDPAVDAPFLRSYDASDMSLEKCMRREKDGNMIGENCAPGSIVFGPYVRVPRGATMRVTFEIHAGTKLEVLSDIVSANGKVLHGSIDRSALEAGAVRTFGYAIHMFEGANAAEARIWLRAERPANLQIKNLKLAVR